MNPIFSLFFSSSTNFLQEVEKYILELIEEFELKYGPCDRRDFEGEFVVPPELRNRTNSLANLRSLKLHGGFLGLSKSRTFLTLPTRHKHNIHASVPDLSRSVPTTPGSNHKLSLASSCDSVLEEPENAELPPKTARRKAKKNKVIKYFFSDNGVELRRRSEDLLDERPKTANYSSMPRAGLSSKARPLTTTINSSAENRMIPVRAKLRAPQPPLTSMLDGLGKNRMNHPNVSSTSLYSIASNDNTPNESPVKTSTPQMRSSKSFADKLGSYSNYTIPRVSLKIDAPRPENGGSGDSTA